MHVPILGSMGSACTTCGFVGTGVPNLADLGRDAATVAAIAVGGLTAGAIAHALRPHAQGAICPQCQRPGSLVPITSVSAKPALESAFGVGATVGDFLLATPELFPFTAQGGSRRLVLTPQDVRLEARFNLLRQPPLFALSYQQVDAIVLSRFAGVRLHVKTHALPPPSKLAGFLHMDPTYLQVRNYRAAQLLTEAFGAIKQAVGG